jgi:outer membrane protein TolC
MLLLLATTAAGAQTLDLRTAQRLAMERNLNLQAQSYATQAADALVRRGFGIYDPVLQADLAAGKANQLNSILTAGSTLTRSFETEYERFNFSLVQAVPTGGQLILAFDNQHQDVSSSLASSSSILNPSFDSSLRLSLVQPLLRGFGRTVTEQEILFAAYDRNLSVQDLRQSAFDLLNLVRNAYFEALRFRDEVAFRRTSVALAERVLEENRARVEAGVLAPVEILEAQVGMQLRERELLDANRAYEDAIDRLALRLNLQEPVDVAMEPLEAQPIETNLEEGVRAALTQRPDVLSRLQEIERLGLARDLARNSLLPQFDLVGSYQHAGLDGTYGGAVSDLSDVDFNSWEIGVLFSYPFGNTAARQELQRVNFLLKSQNSLLTQLRDEVRTEIRSAIRDLDVNRKKIEVTQLGTQLASERLETLLKRKDVGLATTRDVLEGEEDLAEARTLHIAALADYNQAVTAYLLATGQLLAHENFRLTCDLSTEGAPPALNPE